eukprot:jgi/Bigna1/75748/fgenesh1_pg.36_\
MAPYAHFTIAALALPGFAQESKPPGCTCLTFAGQNAETGSFTQYDPNKFFTERQFSFRMCDGLLDDTGNMRPATYEDATGASWLGKQAAALIRVEQVVGCCEWEEVALLLRRSKKQAHEYTSFCEFQFACPYGVGPLWRMTSWWKPWQQTQTVITRRYCRTRAEYWSTLRWVFGGVATVLLPIGGCLVVRSWRSANTRRSGAGVFEDTHRVRGLSRLPFGDLGLLLYVLLWLGILAGDSGAHVKEFFRKVTLKSC